MLMPDLLAIPPELPQETHTVRCVALGSDQLQLNLKELRSPEVAAAHPPAPDPADVCLGLVPASIFSDSVHL